MHTAALLILLLAVAQVEATSNSPTAIATRVLDNMETGQFEAAASDFGDKLRLALSVEKLKEVQQQLSAAGNVQRRDPPRMSQDGDHTIVVIRVYRETATLDATFAIDRSGKLSGLHFVPAAPASTRAVPADPAFREMEVTIGGAETTGLPGTLTMPAVKRRRSERGAPAVVLVHGSGPHDRDETIGENRPFLDLAHGLARSGIAVLRYDKRTKVQPKAFAGRTFTIDDETTKDAIFAIRLLHDAEGVDSKNIFILGHSLGGMLAPRIAERSDMVAGVILWAAPARSVLTVLSEQMRRAFAEDGVLSNEERESLETVNGVVTRVVQDREEPYSSESEALGAPIAYWRSVHQIDAIGDVKKLSCGVLMLHGGHDRQVTAMDWEMWKSALSQKKNVTYKYYPLLDHLGVADDGTSRLSSQQHVRAASQVDNQLVRDVAEWIMRAPQTTC
jgi:dienelactone hydrolase